MKNKIYIIKNLSPWMMDELLAFSKFSKFRVILLRRPNFSYESELMKLEKQGIEIYIKPFNFIPNIRKGLFAIRFAFKNLSRFFGVKNFIFGIKSLFWFVFLKNYLIKDNTSLHAQFATQASIISVLFKQYHKNVDYSFTFHAHDIYFSNGWFDLLVNESNCAFSISEYNLNYVKKAFPDAKKHKFLLSRLGVFLPKRFETRKQKIFTIGFLSWWTEKKGLLVLLQAFDLLIQKQNLQLKLIVAGDGPMRDRTEKFIKKHNLTPYIKDIGKVFGETKRNFYKNIDVFVLPSIQAKKDMDGIPVVLMESISYGIPIISTGLSGIPEICRHNYNGLLIKPNDKYSLSKAILKFYNMKKFQLQEFKHKAVKSSFEYDIVQNSKTKLRMMGWKQTS